MKVKRFTQIKHLPEMKTIFKLGLIIEKYKYGKQSENSMENR